MANITCMYCGIVDSKHKWEYKDKYRKYNRKQQDIKNNNRLDKKVYRSRRWERIRNNILDNCYHIDAYSYYVLGEIRQATCVHHVTEVLEDDSKAYQYDNLIGLNDNMHEVIHRLYKTDKKEYIKQLLINCKEKIENEGIKIEDIGIWKDKVVIWSIPPIYWAQMR